MKVPLPNLDDRRWADLIDEGRSLIPLYAPDWTDHNIHDPGITLLDLFAWIAEQDIYELNRISDEHKRKFLSLIGVVPEPPRAARTVLGFTLHEGVTHCRLQATAEVAGYDSFGVQAPFRLLESVSVAPGSLTAIQIRDGKGYRDATERWHNNEPFGAFGPVPEVGAELYLGFDLPFRLGGRTTLFFLLANQRSGAPERERILAEQAERWAACNPPRIPCKNGGATSPSQTAKEQSLPAHHGVRTVWEYLTRVGSDNKWVPLDPQKGEIEDDTRCLTLEGPVAVRPIRAMEKAKVGKVNEPLYYLRCRFEAGTYDAPPLIQDIIFNGVVAEQATTVSRGWVIPNSITPSGPVPENGDLAGLFIRFDDKHRIAHLEFSDGEDVPKFRVLDYTAPQSARDGSLTIEAVLSGEGTGEPYQTVLLSQAPVQEQSLHLFTEEGDSWQAWELRPDFDASGRGDSHYLLDATTGEIHFGDGENGRVPPPGSLIFARYRVTRAQAGNLPVSPRLNAVQIATGTGAVSQSVRLPAAPVREHGVQLFSKEISAWRNWELRPDFRSSGPNDSHFLLNASDGNILFGNGQNGRVPPAGALIFAYFSPESTTSGEVGVGFMHLLDAAHNRALFKEFDVVKDQIKKIENSAAAGGAPQETLEQESARAIRKMSAVTRAVTLSDYETLAKATPGTHIARAEAIANLNASFPCFKAVGLVTVVVLPDMPVPRPQPGPGLKRVVRSYLNRRRVVGTRVEVVGPSYIEVEVHATVKALDGISAGALRQRIIEALDGFLNPLTGGPEKTGWPFGRDVYRSEILQVIDQVVGVDHVASLELIADGCDPQCGNVCVGPTWLVNAGNHEIEVI